MSVYLVFAGLMLAMIRNIQDESRFLTASVVMFVTTLSYAVYFSGPLEYLVHHLSWWGYLSLAPLLSIALLYYIKSPTSLALMLLFLLIILTHLGCYLIESAGFYVDEVYQYVSWAFYGVELIILFSKRVCYGVVDRIYNSPHLDSHHRHHWPQNSIGAIK